jgi:hypothetical protein
VSLAHLVDAVRLREAWQAIALADATGCLIAGGGAALDCEELAAFAPLLEETGPPANDVVPCRLDILTATTVRRIRVDGIEVILCAYGVPRPRAERLEDAEAGAQRILSSGRPKDGDRRSPDRPRSGGPSTTSSGPDPAR